MFLSYLCSVQLLSAYHKLHVFIAIYCTASLQLSWHLCYEKTRWISLICFTPTLHEFLYVGYIPFCNAGGMVVVDQLQHLNHPTPPLLRHLSALVFLVHNAPFQAWTFHWDDLCLVHRISQQGREKGQMVSGASGASRTPSLWLCWNVWGRWANQILEYLFYFC